MSMDLYLGCLTVSLIMPEAVELSVCMGIDPCGCPISSSEVMSTSPSLSLTNRPSNSTSAAEAITFFIIYATTNISPFGLVCDVRLNISRRNNPPPTPCFLPWTQTGKMHHREYAIAFGLHNI